MQVFVHQVYQHALESGTLNVDILLPGRQSKYKMIYVDKYQYCHDDYDWIMIR